MSGPYELVPVTVASAFVFGIVLALLGSIKLPLARRLGMDEARVGGLLAALNLALIPMMLVSGVLVDHLGVRGVLVAGSLVTALALFLLGMSRTYQGALVALVLTGMGGACLMTASVVLMPMAFFEGRNSAAAVNLGNVFIPLGALATPALADVLVRGVGFRRAVTLLAAACLLPALAACFNTGAAFRVEGDHQLDFWQVAADPVVWLAGLAFMLYSPLEGALGAWATTYLTELGFRPGRAAWLLSGFWLAFLAARLLFSFLQERGVLSRSYDGWLVMFLALLAAVVLGNLAGTRARGNGGTGLLALGFLFGPIFPTLVGLLFDSPGIEPANRGTAFGTMFALGAAGGLLLPPVIGAYARRASVRAALRIPTLVALVLAGAGLVLALVQR
jgi:fucose permease